MIRYDFSNNNCNTGENDIRGKPLCCAIMGQEMWLYIYPLIWSSLQPHGTGFLSIFAPLLMAKVEDREAM